MNLSEAKYVLVTAAKNEEGYIDKTLKAVTSQTKPPEKWVIIDDGSSDHTLSMISACASRYPFIQVDRVIDSPRRDFGSKVGAIARGLELIRQSNLAYDFIGNLDADVSFDQKYYERVIQKFIENPRLGIAGGCIYEKNGGTFQERMFNSPRSVPGAIQLFRKECHDSVGGYLPLPYGGEDWCSEVMARMRNWEVATFPSIRVHHHRLTGLADGSRFRRRWREGLQSFMLGSHPVFELVKSLRRVGQKPYVVGSLIRFSGFCFAVLKRYDRLVSDEFVSFLRKEQKKKLKDTFWSASCGLIPR